LISLDALAAALIRLSAVSVPRNLHRTIVRTIVQEA
jgi:hypothetical protein